MSAISGNYCLASRAYVNTKSRYLIDTTFLPFAELRHTLFLSNGLPGHNWGVAGLEEGFTSTAEIFSADLEICRGLQVAAIRTDLEIAKPE